LGGWAEIGGDLEVCEVPEGGEGGNVWKRVRMSGNN
jgi:hypothetical protein